MPVPANGPHSHVPVVRELRLKRRRTNVPWIYLLYHVDPKPPRAPGEKRPRARRPKTGGQIDPRSLMEVIPEE